MEMQKIMRIHGMTEEIAKKYGKYLDLVQGFRLLDDDFMSKVFEDKACVELLLHIILERDDLSVQENRTEYDIKNLQGRSVRLDILAIDQEGKYYNIEIQRRDDGADAHRARYNSSLMDANLTLPGDRYNELREAYVIFITERDVIGAGLPIYHIDRMIRETGEPFNDGSHIIYVNAQYRDDTPLGKLMHDFSCTQADDMHYSILAKRTSYFKKNVEGVINVCEKVEELIKKGHAEGRAEGHAEGRAEGRAEILVTNVRSLMENLSIPIEKAMDMLNVPPEDRDMITKLIQK